MRMLRSVGCALALAVCTALPAQAQVTVDLSKITCEQWLSYKVADPDHIAMWISGYIHGQRNNTILGVQEFKDNINQLKDLCIRNLNVPLMKLVEDRVNAKK